MARPVSGSVAQQVETLFDGGSVPGLSDRQLLDRFTVRGVGQDLLVALGIDDPRFARLTVPVETGGAVDPQSVTIALEPARIITGRITDAETGKPIPHTQIHITSHRKMGLINEFEADAEGRFGVNPLSADRFSVAASAPEGLPNLSAVQHF